MKTSEINFLIFEFEKNYKMIDNSILQQKLFNKKQKKGILNFGYICPGAVKTLNYIKKNISNIEHQRTLFQKIKRLTDALFFLELIILYKKYLNNKLVRDMNLLINNNSCLIAKIMTGHLTKYFSRLPKKISKNIPDNFYHLRHKTLICSNDEKMVEERIKMLRKIYEGYQNSKDLAICNGRRDGVSGCRDCCRENFGSGQDYNTCVNNCMRY